MQIFQNLAGLVSKQQAKSPVNFKKAVGGSLPLISRSVRIPVLFDFQKDDRARALIQQGAPRVGARTGIGPLPLSCCLEIRVSTTARFESLGKEN